MNMLIQRMVCVFRVGSLVTSDPLVERMVGEGLTVME
jgi:hypothetical protein